MTVLREGLLGGRTVALGAGVRPEVPELLVSLGASVVRLGEGGPGLEDGRGDAGSAPHAVVHDAGAAFGDGGQTGLAAALEDAWAAIAAAAIGVLIPAGSGGKVVLIAPRTGAGEHSEAARAALENLARTLSIEWARYGITATAITPGRLTRDADIAVLVAFLLSGAGDYISGCRLELGAVEPALLHRS